MEASPHRREIVEHLPHECGRAADFDLAFAVAQPQRMRHGGGGYLNARRGPEGRAGVVVEGWPGSGESLPWTGELRSIRWASLVWAVVRHWSPGRWLHRRGRGHGCVGEPTARRELRCRRRLRPARNRRPTRGSRPGRTRG